MQSEQDKMLAGELYNPLDAQLVAARRRTRLLLQALNGSGADQAGERARLLRELIPRCGADVWLEPPFYCDYGSNIRIGDRVFMNFNCVILDAAPVHIGSDVLLGPAVQIYAATHPLRAEERSSGLECARPVAIGDQAWIGGGAILCPGVTIGKGTVIGAGSVVTKDMPEGVLAAGNPCRILRAIAPRQAGLEK